MSIILMAGRRKFFSFLVKYQFNNFRRLFVNLFKLKDIR